MYKKNVLKIVGIRERYLLIFYLPDFNLIIEYDGLHHYEPIDNRKERYIDIVKHDNIKIIIVRLIILIF